MMSAEEETQFTYQKKKGVAAERKEAKLEKQEADRYARLREEYAEKQILYHLFKLYHNEKDIQRYSDDLKVKQGESNKLEEKKSQADEVLRDKKKDGGKISRELAKLEQDIREAESEMNKKHPLFIKAKEKVAHTQKKLDGAVKTLEQAKKADEAHQSDIKKLEDEERVIMEKKKKFESEMAIDSQRRGSDIQLEQNFLKEYDHLKQQADLKSAKYLSKLDSINREQKSDQDLLDSEVNKKTQLEETFKKYSSEKEEAIKRKEKLLEHIRSSEAQLAEQNKNKDELSRDVGSSRDRQLELQREIENVNDQLGDAKNDKHEDARRKKKQEVVELFKREIPGVYDRMINMCQPTNKRYNVAVTKVLGKYMEAIIVDTEKTARKCIQMLKDQKLEVETFLPLDYLQAKPLKERLRTIQNPKGVHLIYDVLRYDPPAIERAVLFATNNALVCETPEDAMKVAYEMDRSRYDALALDGTFYQKSGIISGGSHDLARKAKRWDEKHMNTLKLQKEKLNEEFKEVTKKTRKQGELTTIESQIKGIENRLKYSKNDLATSDKTIRDYDRWLSDLQKELDQIGPSISDIERRMQQRDSKIQEIKEKMNTVEDEYFKSFCKKIGVANIRQYEDRELVLQQEKDKKLAEFEQQIDRINTNLDFERSKDTQKNVQRWERAVQDDEDSLESLKQAEKRHREDIEKDKSKVEDLKLEKQNKKKLVDEMEEDTGKARRDVAALAKDLANISHQISSCENKIETKRNERHNILRQCKMDDISIPMSKGNMDDILQEPDNVQDTSSSASLSTLIQQRINIIEIDYRTLARNLKDIDESDQVKKSGDNLNKELQQKLDTLEKIQTPNMKAMAKLDLVTEKIQTTNEEFESAKKKAKKAKAAFEKVKNERIARFNKCSNHIADAIDGIYKALARNDAAQAFLNPDNPEESYLDGINYNCVAPGKRFQPMSNLSGGEKTIAALALLFAIHR